MQTLINATVRRHQDAPWALVATTNGWPKIYGTVVDETGTRARISWTDGTLTWEEKRDLYVCD